MKFQSICKRLTATRSLDKALRKGPHQGAVERDANDRENSHSEDLIKRVRISGRADEGLSFSGERSSVLTSTPFAGL